MSQKDKDIVAQQLPALPATALPVIHVRKIDDNSGLPGLQIDTEKMEIGFNEAGWAEAFFGITGYKTGVLSGETLSKEKCIEITTNELANLGVDLDDLAEEDLTEIIKSNKEANRVKVTFDEQKKKFKKPILDLSNLFQSLPEKILTFEIEGKEVCLLDVASKNAARIKKYNANQEIKRREKERADNQKKADTTARFTFLSQQPAFHNASSSAVLQAAIEAIENEEEDFHEEMAEVATSAKEMCLQSLNNLLVERITAEKIAIEKEAVEKAEQAEKNKELDKLRKAAKEQEYKDGLALAISTVKGFVSEAVGMTASEIKEKFFHDFIVAFPCKLEDFKDEASLREEISTTSATILKIHSDKEAAEKAAKDLVEAENKAIAEKKAKEGAIEKAKKDAAEKIAQDEQEAADKKKAADRAAKEQEAREEAIEKATANKTKAIAESLKDMQEFSTFEGLLEAVQAGKVRHMTWSNFK